MNRIMIYLFVVMVFFGCKKDAEDNFALLAGIGLSGNTGTASAAAWTVSGTISGLTASGLKLKLNGSEEISPASGDSSFAFTIELADGDSYSVTVTSNANNLKCSASSSFGTISGNVSDVLIACSEMNYGNLLEATAGLSGTQNGSVSLGDVDSDGDQDLLITGNDGSSAISKLYTNDGAGNFTDSSAALTGVQYSSSCFGDVDGDGDRDLLISGSTGSTVVTKLYRNNGTGSFDGGADLGIAVYYSSCAFGDIDGDSDLDIVIIGTTDGSNANAKVYKNNGTGSFDAGTDLATAVSNGFVKMGDVDGDGDMDLVITGNTVWINFTTTLTAKIYKNNGTGTFDAGTDLAVGVNASSGDLADIDNDGDVDLVIIGHDGSGASAKVYKNNGSGAFDAGTDLSSALFSGSVNFGDFDNDGDVDLFVTGTPDTAIGHTILYINDGTGNFTDSSAGLTGMWNSSCSPGDVDGDGDLDLVVSGFDGAVQLSKIYKNSLVQ